MPDVQTFPHRLQFCGSKRTSVHVPLQQVWEPRTALRWQHVMGEPERQIWSRGQQYGLRPGPTCWPGAFSAT
jgi:hypothetical protein